MATVMTPGRFLCKWPTCCTNSFLCIYFYL